jgi:hypothetical protein
VNYTATPCASVHCRRVRPTWCPIQQVVCVAPPAQVRAGHAVSIAQQHVQQEQAANVLQQPLNSTALQCSPCARHSSVAVEAGATPQKSLTTCTRLLAVQHGQRTPLVCKQ